MPGVQNNRVQEIDSVGLVFFRKNRKAKRIVLRVGTTGIRVSLPVHVSFETAVSFVEQKIEWIGQHLEKFRFLKENPPLHIQQASAPDQIAIKTLLIARTRELALFHCLTVNKITIRKQKRLWGSCSGNANISLNIKLGCLPEHLRDYVLLHELGHTVHRNHGKQFWALIDKLTDGNAKKLDKELKFWPLYLLPD